MNAVLKHFDLLATAPGGTEELRKLILELAVRGRLVSQDPADQSADILLERIRAEKARLVKEGKIKPGKPLPPIAADEAPYALPKGWRWVRLGEIGETNIGLTYSPSDISLSGTPVLRSNNVKNGQLDLSDLIRVRCSIKETVTIRDGDLLICARNGSRALVGKAAIIKNPRERMAFGAFMAIFRSCCSPFLLYFINSPLFRKMIDEVNTMTINQITQHNLRMAVCPLPPLAEQERIVAKVKELTERLDRYAALDERRRAVRTAAREAALRTAAAGEAGAWKRLETRFDILLDDPAGVKSLRRTILELAVRGRLVPQNPADESADSLCERIRAEKARLVKEGKIKPGKPLPPIAEGEAPYALPKGWRWVRLGEAGETQTGNTPPTTIPENYGEAIPFIGPGDIQGNQIIISTAGLSIKGMQVARVIEKHSVLMVCIGGSIGKHAINFQPITCNQQINVVTPIFVAYEFIFYALGSDTFQVETTKRATGSATPIINKQKWSEIPIPLPPLAEQERIVAKVKDLMAVCDRLEAALVERDGTAWKYAEAAVAMRA